MSAIAAMLKSGGRAVILEFSPPEKHFIGELYRFYQVLRSMENSGFKDLSCRRLNLGTVNVYYGRK